MPPAVQATVSSSVDASTRRSGRSMTRTFSPLSSIEANVSRGSSGALPRIFSTPSPDRSDPLDHELAGSFGLASS